LKDYLYIDLHAKAYLVLKLRLEASIIANLLSPAAQAQLAQLNGTVILGQIQSDYAGKELQLEVAQNLSAICHNAFVTLGAKINETRDLISTNIAAIVSGSVALYSDIKVQLAANVVADFSLHVSNALLAIHNDVLDGVQVGSVVVGNVQATLDVVLYVKVGVTLSVTDIESLRAHVAAVVAAVLKTPNVTAGAVASTAPGKRFIMQSGSNLTVPMTVSDGSSASSTGGPSTSTGSVGPSTSTGSVGPSTSTGSVGPSTSTGSVTPATSSGTPNGPATTPTSSSSAYFFGLSSLLVVFVATLMQL